MRRLPLIASLVAAVAGIFGAKPEQRPERRRGRPGSGWTQRLRAKMAKARLERYGLDVLAPDGRPDPDGVRAMRRARKQERQLVRPARTPVPVTGGVHPCAKYNRLRSLGKRKQHVRGSRACRTCRRYFHVLAQVRAGKAPK